MAARKPPPRTIAADQQRKLHAFRERASAFVLDSPVMDAELWAQLTTLADELGLAHEQLRLLVEEWKRLGVIERFEISLPSPPPLPKHRDGQSASAKTGHEPAAAAAPAGSRSAPPLPPPVPKNPPRRPARTSQSDAGAPTVGGGGSQPEDARAPGKSPAGESPRDRFLKTAAGIIAEHRGMGPLAQARLLQSARELGLDDDEAAEAIKALHAGETRTDAPSRAECDGDVAAVLPPSIGIRNSPGRRPVGPPPPNAASADSADQADPGAPPGPQGERSSGKSVPTVAEKRRWKVADEPPPPAPAKKYADEEFRELVAKSLDKLAQDNSSRDLVDGLVNQGYKVLKISKPYARDIVCEVAAAKGLPVETEAADAVVVAEAPADPRMKAFLERAGSILAQHRGLNAKSRVLLGAVAREVGLDDGELESAIRLLESDRPDPDAPDSVQQRRLDPFKKPLRERLSNLPHGILTPAIQETLLEQAEHRFGLTTETTRAAIREAVAELKVQVISESEAVRHIEGLVAEAMGDNLRLPSDVMARIVAEGDRWGLSTARVEDIVCKQSTDNYRRKRSEQKLSNAALMGAGLAILVVVGFLGWTMISGSFSSPTTPKDETNVVKVDSTGNTAAAPQEEPFDTSWWNASMSIAARNARLELYLPTRTINDIAALDADRRIAAYEMILEKALDPKSEVLERRIVEELLAHAYAREPSDEAAAAIADGLLEPVPGPGARLSKEASDYPRMFEALRIALAALDASAKAESRSDLMARQIGTAIGVRVDTEQASKAREQQCLGALAERLFRLLIASASVQPTLVAELHRVISDEARRYLDEASLDSLNADFLLALLATAEEQWREFRTLIADTIRAQDPLTVDKLVDLYENAASDELREYMGGLLLARAGRGTVDRSQSELADEVRSALGVSSAPTPEGRQRRFKQLALRELDALEATKDSPGALLQEVVRLSYVTTLGTALASGDAGHTVFDELEKEGPPVLAVDEAGSGRHASRPRDADWSSLDAIDRSLEMLARQGPAGRAERVESMARAVDRVPDIRPDQARMLAAYLLNASDEAEHRIAMRHIPKLARWKQLRLAIADNIGRSTLQPEQMKTLLSQLVGEDVAVELMALGEQGALAARAALLRDVVSDLAEAESGTDRIDSGSFDQARDTLLAHYLKQAELLGIPATDFGDDPAPAGVLRRLLEHEASTLSGRSLSDDAQRLVRDLPHHLIAIDYVTNNDLHATVLLQRLFIELAAAATRLKSAGSAAEIDRLLSQLQQADRSEDNVFVQLREGQAALVRLQLAAMASG